MNISSPIALGVNIDHIATLRQQRRTPYPDLLDMVVRAQQAGAEQITLHLREDRRHIQDADLPALRPLIRVMNLETAVSKEMIDIACHIKPDWVCLVPEKRQELTTEGGLAVVGVEEKIRASINMLHQHHIKVSLFIDADANQIMASKACGADAVELHTGRYADLYLKAHPFVSPHAINNEAIKSVAHGGLQNEVIKKTIPILSEPIHPHPKTTIRIPSQSPFTDSIELGEAAQALLSELESLSQSARLAHSIGLRANAGHGLTLDNVGLIAAMPHIRELNIGHAIVCDALLMGWEAAIIAMKHAMAEGVHTFNAHVQRDKK